MTLERSEGNDLGCLLFTWANGKQNPVLVHSVRESRLPIRHKSVPFTEKGPRKPKTGIKDRFEEMEHKFRFGTFRPGKQDYHFQRFRSSRKFFTGTSRKVVGSIYFLIYVHMATILDMATYLDCLNLKRNAERECPTSVLQMTGCLSQYF